jgi:hypothetical protein
VCEDSNVLMSTFWVLWITNAVKFGRPKLVRWVADVSKRVLKGLQKEGRDVINVWEVLGLIRVI